MDARALHLLRGRSKPRSKSLVSMACVRRTWSSFSEEKGSFVVTTTLPCVRCG
jgi:hypothetical protein